MTPPVVNIGRMKRLTEPIVSNKDNFATQICFAIILLMGLYLFKRFKDKQQSRTQRILQQ